MLYLLAAITVTVVWHAPPATVRIYPCTPCSLKYQSRCALLMVQDGSAGHAGMHRGSRLSPSARWLGPRAALSFVDALIRADRRLTTWRAQAQYHFEHSQTSPRSDPGHTLVRLLERCQADSMDLSFTRGRWVCYLPIVHLLTGHGSRSTSVILFARGMAHTSRPDLTLASTCSSVTAGLRLRQPPEQSFASTSCRHWRQM